VARVYRMEQSDDARPVDGTPPPGRRQMFAPRSDVAHFLLLLVRRSLNDLCLERAAALSYTSVLSLVPAAGVSLIFLSSLPGADDLRSAVEDLLTQYLLPHAGQAAVVAFRAFLAKAAGVSAIGFLGLAVTAMMLLATINSAFDTIWRVRQPRPLATRLLAYWAVLTVGPTLIGIALSISGVLLATGERYGGSAFTWSMGWFAPLVPFGLETAAFALLYRVAPNCPVRWRDSLAGGCLAGLLFEGAKHGFAVYVVWFSSYSTLYGTLAAIPVFLVWVYLCWMATLVGAELAAALPEWRVRPRAHPEVARPPENTGITRPPGTAA
jgi:membrane protein